MNSMKPAARVAYVVLDNEGEPKESNWGALLVYTNKDDALRGSETYGGAKVVKYRFLYDGEIETVDVS